MVKIWDQFFFNPQTISEQVIEKKKTYTVQLGRRDKFQELETSATDKESKLFMRVLLRRMIEKR